MVPTIRDNSVVSSSGRRSGRLGVVASPATSRQTPQPATPINPNHSLSVTPSNSHSSTGRLSSMIPGSPSEAHPSSSLVDRDGIVALERIEHDHELTYEIPRSDSDMRIDIDNMSYEEEYVDGDEVGTMPCEHMYHVSCVQQWLRMKNWCPICKTSAEEKS
ncbi:hypothetical protein HID58_089417 [Brassica napus]|uniref:RING-type E3 ubiquitin transferase n=1 Tax=Brassica napus TaxID=3708 RepID=A0ABQ7XZ35_BRANA|nr:hypothetical protein HID58_089417 [Brassica napus]